MLSGAIIFILEGQEEISNVLERTLRLIVHLAFDRSVLLSFFSCFQVFLDRLAS